MARRFSRIRQGAILNDALTNYIQHLTNVDRVRNVGGGRDRSPTVVLGVEPFGFDLPAATSVRVTTTQRSRAPLQAAIGTRAIVPAAGATNQRIPGFKPAKVILFQGTGASSVVRSAITNQPYLKYAGESYSHPFGRNAASDAEYDAFSEIQAALAGGNKRVSYQAEERKQV